MSKRQPEPLPIRKRTAKQQEASRGNPRLRDFFSEKLFALDVEYSTAFHLKLQAFLAEWQPSGPAGEFLVRTLACESIAQDRYRLLEIQLLNALTGRLSHRRFTNGQPEDPGEILSGAVEQGAEEGRLPLLAFAARAIGRAERNFRTTLSSLLLLRKVGQASSPVAVAQASSPLQNKQKCETNPRPIQNQTTQELILTSAGPIPEFPGFSPGILRPRVPGHVPQAPNTHGKHQPL